MKKLQIFGKWQYHETRLELIIEIERGDNNYFLHVHRQKFLLLATSNVWYDNFVHAFNNNDNNNNEFISAYPFYMKLALRPKIIYTKKKYYTMRYPEIIS